MTTLVYNGISYDLQVVGGTLQYRITGSGPWISHPQMVGLVGPVHCFTNALWVYGVIGGNYYSTDLENPNVFNLNANSADYDGTSWGQTPIVITNDATPPNTGGSGGSSGGSSAVHSIETTLTMNGQKIVNLAPATTPTGAVNLSQLTAAVASLTAAYQAGDTALATELDALEQVVLNLPQGITMTQVQEAIAASVAEAVLNEVIEDDQKKAIVDAALAQLSTIDTAVIGRVTTTEGQIASLEPRVASAESTIAAHAASIAQGVTKDAAHDTAIAALQAVDAAQAVLNAANSERLSQLENVNAVQMQVITPIEVRVVAGALTQAIGVNAAGVSIDNSSATHMQVTIDLGSDTNGQRRVASAYRLMPNGAERQIFGDFSRYGESYIFVVLKSADGSNSINFVLN